VDALPPAWLPVPVLLVAGIVMDERALADADAVLGDPQPGLLRNAATAGLRDPAIASVARDLADIALRGCARLGSRVAGADAEVAREYFECTVRRGRNIDAAAQNPVPTAA
jgi:hypothetical protein